MTPPATLETLTLPETLETLVALPEMLETLVTPPETLETLVTPPKMLETLVIEEEPDAADTEARGVVDKSLDPVIAVEESNVADESPVAKYDAGGNHIVESGSYPVDAGAFPPPESPDIAD